MERGSRPFPLFLLSARDGRLSKFKASFLPLLFRCHPHFHYKYSVFDRRTTAADLVEFPRMTTEWAQMTRKHPVPAGARAHQIASAAIRIGGSSHSLHWNLATWGSFLPQCQLKVKSTYGFGRREDYFSHAKYLAHLIRNGSWLLPQSSRMNAMRVRST